jgi:riboflavin kinase / FMN adenylyltransferase
MSSESLKVLHGLDGLRQLPAGAALSVGNFDGLHRGHRHILDLLKARREHSGASSIAIVTFEPHPLTVLRPDAAPPRLSPPAMKQALLAAAGVDYEVILPPAPEVLNLTAEAFWAILRDQVRPSHIVEGGGFTFGKGRGGNIESLKRWAAEAGIPLHVARSIEVPLVDLMVVPVSSSLIRWLLRNGRVRDAAICLGRPYGLEGEVVKGFQRGRTIGVPTANLKCGGQLIPADGVYAGRCIVDGSTYPVAMSIGTMPTFSEAVRQVEAHLIGFDGDLYGRVIQVELLDWLRDQQRFGGVEALKAQLQRDIGRAREWRGRDAARAIARTTDSVT